jgi:hypothetical protein
MMKLNPLTTCAIAGLGMSLTCHAATNLLDAPGFEGLTPGAIADGGDSNAWASFSDGQNNMSVSTAFARTGTQSLQSGPNGASKFTSARQSEIDAFAGPGDIEGKTFDFSFWVYYNSADAPTGSLRWQFLATNPFNVHRLDQAGTISIAELTADAWTLFTYQFTVPVVDPAPVDPNLITNRVNVQFQRNGFVDGATTGNFYVDDVSASLAVPEPSILGLLALAPAMALRRRRA